MGFEELGKKLLRLGQDTKNGVQKVGETYQLNSKLADEKKKLDQLYRAIGEAVYAAHTEKPLENMEEEFEAIKEVLENIEDINEQINRKKGIAFCTECGKEASRGENFCAGCGAKLPEVEDDYSEKMKQDAKEAVDEAGEIMGDVMVKAKGFMGNMVGKADAFVKGVASRVNNPNKDDVVAELEEHEVTTMDAEDAAEGSADAPTSVEEGMETSPEEILEEAQETVEEAAETAGETVEEVLEAVEEAVDDKEEK